MPGPSYRGAMTTITSIIVEVTDPASAESFYAAAFPLGDRLRVRAGDAPSQGFRGFSLSLIVSQPANVTVVFDAAVAVGAEVIKPVTKTMWGTGATFRAPDGTIWKVATPAKKDTAPASSEIESIVLLLAADDVSATKKFYVEKGLTIGKSFGKYVEFDLPGSPITLGLYSRKALAKDAGVDPEGSGSHRILIGGGQAFTDPDGFVWVA